MSPSLEVSGLDEARFVEYCRARGVDEDRIYRELASVQALERFARERGTTMAALDTETLQSCVGDLIRDGLNTEDNLAGLARYMSATGRTDLYLHLTGLFAGREVLPSIARRLADIAGQAVSEEVFRGFELPPLGSGQRTLSPIAQHILSRLRFCVGDDTAKHVLAGNHHGIPGDRFAPLRQIYLGSGIDAALAERHSQLVITLEQHLMSGRPWFEQVVTRGFVEYVRGNQEIGAGLREGDTIYFCKVPYAPQEYLDARDLTLKRYYLCHCPLAREAIIDADVTVDPMLCYCSAGFTKVAFDVIFGRPVKVEVLESALAGDTRCRFAIAIPAEG